MMTEQYIWIEVGMWITGGLMVVLIALVVYVFVTAHKRVDEKIADAVRIINERSTSAERKLCGLETRHVDLGKRLGDKVDGLEKENGRIERKLLEYQVAASSSFILKDDCRDYRETERRRRNENPACG